MINSAVPDHHRLRQAASPVSPVGAPGKLNEDQIAALRRHFPMTQPLATTSPIQAGYALGVEAVLEVLRNGWVPR